FFFFFFQAEDGIRDGHVTGVQTCALPILFWIIQEYRGGGSWRTITNGLPTDVAVTSMAIDPKTPTTLYVGLSSYRPARTRGVFRSEERRVGKEGRSQW